MIIKIILISIIGSITNLLPISYNTHIFLYDNLFNTKIFNDTLIINSVYLSIPISIIFLYHKNIIKIFSSFIKTLFTKNNKTKLKISFLNKLLISTLISTIIYLLIPKIKLTIKTIPIYLIITSIIILISNNKTGTKKTSETNIKDSLIFSISSLFTIIPTISPLCSNLFISKILKFDKKTSLLYSLLTLIPLYIIKSFTYINFITEEYLAYIILTIIISTIISIKTIKYLKYLYNQNKLYKLSIYCILLSLFISFWFR